MAKSKGKKPAKGGAGKVAEGDTVKGRSRPTECFVSFTPPMFTSTARWLGLTATSHLAGARSAPFEAGEQKQVAVKVIDDPEIENITAEDLLGDYPAVRYTPPTGSFYIDIHPHAAW